MGIPPKLKEALSQRGLTIEYSDAKHIQQIFLEVTGTKLTSGYVSRVLKGERKNERLLALAIRFYMEKHKMLNRVIRWGKAEGNQ